MDAQAIFEHLRARFGDAVSDFSTENTRDPFFKVRAGAWPEVARALRDDTALRFDFLDVITAVDFIKQDRIDVVYHLFSYALRHAVVVKIELPRAAPKVPSVTQLWKSADWQEREQYDLLGVEFVGHPDLRRLLLPDDWEGHPLRKDFRERSSYNGMPTTRPSPLQLLPIYDKAHKP